ncbi:dynein heavy chain [Culex quinquefasciatus]|uniref:Dynein heavy chain n=1 Tax=Culex quinquefasciatus TaxID=7176 RepID=B0WKT2_CULQU|nr:dynein heavy chain [Culex quinquefasciatus]|eukprot:XP_001849316.1 dynein heavy chain [Culex quinquefasciatus]
MNFFLRQEIDHVQRVINMVYTNLGDLKLAIEGSIIMSNYLRESLDALGFWKSGRSIARPTLLPEHNTVLSVYSSFCHEQKEGKAPCYSSSMDHAYRISEVTRAHKGWALDSVVLQNQITRYNK